MTADRRAPPPRVLFAGPLPPPVHGFAAMNALSIDALRMGGAEVAVFDTAPPRIAAKGSGLRGAALRLVWRALRDLWLLLSFAGAALGRRRATLYLGFAGGWGQPRDLGFLLIARALGLRRVLHHHSYSYVGRRSAMSALLFRAAGRAALHIVLCDGMGAALKRRYGSVARVLALSNAAFQPVDPAPAPTRAPTGHAALGFLGAVTRDKGIDVFLETIRQLTAAGAPVRGLIAGPEPEAEAARAIDAAIAAGAPIERLGPVYGAEKTAFLQRIDALLLPSRYRHEAEPLVILEAMAHGAAVFAADRGCIAEQLGAEAGEAALGALWRTDFANDAAVLAALERFCRDPSLRQQAQTAALARSATLRRQAAEQRRAWSAALALDGGGTPAPAPAPIKG